MARECIAGFLGALVEAGEPIPVDEIVEPPVDALVQVDPPATAA